jgi:hypothetical protein
MQNAKLRTRARTTADTSRPHIRGYTCATDTRARILQAPAALPTPPAPRTSLPLPAALSSARSEHPPGSADARTCPGIHRYSRCALLPQGASCRVPFRVERDQCSRIMISRQTPRRDKQAESLQQPALRAVVVLQRSGFQRCWITVVAARGGDHDEWPRTRTDPVRRRVSGATFAWRQDLVQIGRAHRHSDHLPEPGRWTAPR